MWANNEDNPLEVKSLFKVANTYNECLMNLRPFMSWFRHFIQCDGGSEYCFKLVFVYIKPYKMETLGLSLDKLSLKAF
jgi:hypothetical protein